jgi:hypothetical protein
MERSLHDWNVGFSDERDGSHDDPFVQAVGSPTPAHSGRIALNLNERSRVRVRSEVPSLKYIFENLPDSSSFVTLVTFV